MNIKILVPLLMFPLLMWGQNFKSISGKVTDDLGSPVEGVHVQVDEKIIAVTDVNGMYELKNIPADNVAIKVTALGFTTQLHKIELKGQQRVEFNLILEPSVELLDNVVVATKSEKHKKEETAQAVSVIETREATFKTADLGEVMAQTQGVTIRRRGGFGSKSNFSLNGLTGNQIRFFMDGIPLQYHGYTFGAATVPVNLINRIEIYKGVVPIEFGADALGGAVNMISPKIHPGFTGSISAQVGSFGTYRTSVLFSNYNKNTGFFIEGSGFYDYSKNNYKVDVKVADDKGQIKEVTVPRFHDAYKGYGIRMTTGVKNRLWAKELDIEGYYTDYTKDIQHNQLMEGIPYGEVVTYRKAAGTVITYSNDFGESSTFNLVTGYNHRERRFVDISDLVYNWYGKSLPDSKGNTRGEIGESNGPSDTYTWNNDVFARIKTSWKIAEQHILRFTSALTYSNQTGNDIYIEAYDPANARRNLFTWVNGADYKIEVLDGQLENIFFVKNYLQNINSKARIPPKNIEAIKKRSEGYFGVGNGLRFKFNEQFSTKLTYEHATRLPETNELFGDGQFIQGNIDLEPERSHNINFELFYNSKNNDGASKWQVQTNAFLRKVDNQILFVPSVERNNIYENVFSATSTGLEISGNWTSKNNKLTLSANSTYQHFYNDSKEGLFKAYHGERIPNQPYFFANGAASYSFENIFKNTDKLTFFLDGRYVYKFFRSWESASLNPFVIPSQQVYNIGSTYQNKIGNTPYALTAEVQNFSNEKNYDFYGVQKPGRALYIKLVIHFK